MLNEAKTIDELAACIEMQPWQLKKVLYSGGGANTKYRQFEVIKKTGGIRKIDAPEQSLKHVQKRIAAKINDLLALEKGDAPFVPLSQAYQKGHGIYTNALVHRNKKLVLNIDISDFFPSLHFGRVAGFFMKNKNFLLSKEVAVSIAQLTCHNGVLAQGSALSPVISNLIFQAVDQHILKVTRKYKLTYTRYADDMTFSTNNFGFLNELEEFVKSIESQIKADGFSINWSKMRLSGPDVRQTVTGLSINKKVNVSKQYYKNTRSMALSLYTTGFFHVDGQRYDQNMLSKLEGRFSYINDIVRKNNLLYEQYSFEYLATRANNKSRLLNEKKSKPSLHPEAFSSSEKAYRNFLFYKYFYKNKKPLIVTEGHTDAIYLKTAIKNLKISNLNLDFLKRSKMTKYFFGFIKGGDSLKNIANLYLSSQKSNVNISNKMYNYGVIPDQPVILLLDHEMHKKEKKDSPLLPLANYLKGVSKFPEIEDFFCELHKHGFIHLTSNLYIAVVSKKGTTKDDIYEIENLFPNTLLNDVFGMGTFEKVYSGKGRKIDKNDFALIIRKHWNNDIFQGFKVMLDVIDKVCLDYEKRKQRMLEKRQNDEKKAVKVGNKNNKL
ncbi:retron Ec67 family RNA-directed DNA polymerase/endonuclease [Leuconostoc mesenteroides]